MVTTHWGELDHRASERELRYLDLLARQAADLLEQRAAAQALREKEQRAQTLLAELQHRVRNTLAVMRSIVRRTALGSKTVEEFEQHLGGRLSSFARTQAYVVRDPEGGVDLELIVRDELLAHATGDAQHISIEGPKVRLDARQAEIFGLAVHELTSNAIRHGALASDGNKVDVKWSVKGNDDMRTVRFSWQEKLDRNNLEKPERTGFGIELLDRVLSYELDARPLIEFRPDGYCYQVEFPLATNRKGSAPTH